MDQRRGVVTKGFLLLGFHIRHTAFTSPSIHDIMFNLIILYDKHVPDAADLRILKAYTCVGTPRKTDLNILKDTTSDSLYSRRQLSETNMATVQNTCPVFEDWTAPAIVQHINRHGLTLGDAQRAWTVLGYKTPNGAAYAKPSPDGFQTRIVNLWNFLLRHADDRVGRRARLYILEALKSLRYYRRWWTVDSPLDQINQSYDMGIFWHTQLEPPLGNVTVSKWEAARDCVLYPPLSSFNMPWMIAYAREEPADATIEEDEIWHKFHPFRKGFVARDHRGIEHRFRAMPEPDPDSLWCSISLVFFFFWARLPTYLPTYVKEKETNGILGDQI